MPEKLIVQIVEHDGTEAHWRGRADRTHLYFLATEGWKTVVKLAGWE